MIGKSRHLLPYPIPPRHKTSERAREIHLGVDALGIGRAAGAPAVGAFVDIHALMATVVRSPRPFATDTLCRTHARVSRRTLTAFVAGP